MAKGGTIEIDVNSKGRKTLRLNSRTLEMQAKDLRQQWETPMRS